jgi:hypothetical protein
MSERTLIRLTHNPSRRIAHPQIQNLATAYQLIKTLHQLRHTRRKIPPMHIQQIDVVGLQFLKTGLDRHAHRFRAVAREVDALAGAGVARVGETGCEFCGEDDFGAVGARGHPFSDPCFGFFVLIIVCAGECQLRIWWEGECGPRRWCSIK